MPCLDVVSKETILMHIFYSIKSWKLIITVLKFEDNPVNHENVSRIGEAASSQTQYVARRVL